MVKIFCTNILDTVIFFYAYIMKKPDVNLTKLFLII